VSQRLESREEAPTSQAMQAASRIRGTLKSVPQNLRRTNLCPPCVDLSC
jgi:hypothetical protein